MDMFDDDDTLMYEPALTAAIILTGDDEEAEKAALEVGPSSMSTFCAMTHRCSCSFFALAPTRLTVMQKQQCS